MTANVQYANDPGYDESGYPIVTDSVAGMSNHNTIVLMGDSIVSNNVTKSGGLGNNSSTNLKGIFSQLNAKLYHRFNVTNYAGVGGENAAQMLARFSTDVLDFSPKYLWLQPGVNDMRNGVTAVNTYTSVKSMLDQSIAAGIKVILCTTLPTSDTTYVPTSIAGALSADLTTMTQARITEWNAFNQLLRDYSTSNDGVILIDWAGGYSNFSTYALSRLCYPMDLFTSDGIHPNANGCNFLSDVAFDILDPIIPKSYPTLACNSGSNAIDGDTTNGAENGMMVGTAGGISTGGSGVVADQWRIVQQTATIFAACSKVARTDNLAGEWQRCNVSGATSINSIIRLDQSVPITLADLDWSVGDTFVFEAELRLSNIVGEISWLMPDVRITATVNEDHQALQTVPGADTSLTVMDKPILMRTLPIVLPAGSTALLPVLKMGTSVGGSATFDWGNVRMYRVAIA